MESTLDHDTAHPAQDSPTPAFLMPGIKLFDHFGLATKALVIALVLALPLIAIILYGLDDDRKNQLQSRKDSTRQHVEIALGVLDWAHGQQLSGTMTQEQAQGMARDMIRDMRYDDKEYFWINDMEPRVIMHPTKPSLEGTNVAAVKDPNGLALFKEFADTVKRQQKGFVSYQWPKPGSENPVDKLSYVSGFKPWGWIVGSGIYLDDLQADYQERVSILLKFAILGTVIALYFLLAGYKSIQQSMRGVIRQMQAISQGDLTTDDLAPGKDELARLSKELHAMQYSLATMVARVRSTSEDIVHSSSEIANGSMDLATRTEEASEHLEESAASMEEITSTVKNSASNTREASRKAQENAVMAANGGEAMRDVADTMNAIHAQSESISKITSTIDDIAFQTNLLALNAAVEAARAGESGRGFAVVASEVRILAQRSADAAREINLLIDSSVKKVADGAKVVKRASDTIESIIESSHHVDRLLNDVSISAQEQSVGVSQIGDALTKLDQMTQNNAALVNETTSATRAMQNHADLLATEVSNYRLPAGIGTDHDNGLLTEYQDVSHFDFDSAIEAHRQWKVKLRKAMSHLEQLDSDVICRDDACALGQWLHGEGGRLYEGKPIFQDLVQSHARFHQCAATVANSINAGEIATAEKQIRAGSEFSSISNEVCSLLTQAKRNLN